MPRLLRLSRFTRAVWTRQRRSSPLALTVAATLALALAAAIPSASAYPRPGRTQVVSSASSSAEADNWADFPTISDDGRFVAFSSHATNLVPGDTNGGVDVFVHDRVTGATELVSVASDGTHGNNANEYPGETPFFDHEVDQPSISADGHFVAFSSLATNLVPGDTNGAADVFVHDRETGETERVSVATGGGAADGWSLFPDISGDGRVVTFSSFAMNLVQGDTNGFQDVFVHDRDTGVTERVSVSSDEEQGDFDAFDPSISRNGRFVAFHGGSSNLVPRDLNFNWDVFVRDRFAGRTELASVSTDGVQGNGGSAYAEISGDGSVVAFYSDASNLVPTDGNATQDTYVHNRLTSVTRRVSVSSSGAQGNGPSGALALSRDGSVVAFNSLASNLVAADLNGTTDIFVHDVATGQTERVNLADNGSESQSWTTWIGLSGDGRYAAFGGAGPFGQPGESATERNIFVRDRGPAVGVEGLDAAMGGGRVEATGWATFSGETVAWGTDPGADGAPGAREVGAELVGASVALRPEQEDLLVRLSLATLPGWRSSVLPFYFLSGFAGFVPSDGGLPAVVYGTEFLADGAQYEVRALRLRAGALPAAARSFALYRCGESCDKVADLTGGMGTTGVDVVVAVPLAAIGDPSSLTAARAFTAIGEEGEGGRLDQLTLPDAALPNPEVRLGAAAPGTPEADVEFGPPVPLLAGTFEGQLDVGPGQHDVWARACLGADCGSAVVRVATD